MGKRKKLSISESISDFSNVIHDIYRDERKEYLSLSEKEREEREYEFDNMPSHTLYSIDELLEIQEISEFPGELIQCEECLNFCSIDKNLKAVKYCIPKKGKNNYLDNQIIICKQCYEEKYKNIK